MDIREKVVEVVIPPLHIGIDVGPTKRSPSRRTMGEILVTERVVEVVHDECLAFEDPSPMRPKNIAQPMILWHAARASACGA